MTEHRPPTDLANRRGLRIRPLETGETGPLLEVFAGLSPRSRELRFLVPQPRLTPSQLRQLSDVDGHHSVALVAESTGGRPVGIARFFRDRGDPESAEVAVTVVDAWHSRGVGTRLVAALVDRARDVGVRRFSLVVHHENRAALRLLHRFSAGAERVALDRFGAEYAVTLAGDAAGHRISLRREAC
jgi:RimJ/RimL family protein N-acetyltransferase